MEEAGTSQGNAWARAQVERWRDELLDLTGRNRLLRYRHTRTSSLEIDAPGAQEILDRLLDGRSRDWTIHVPTEAEEPPDLDPTAAVVGVGEPERVGSHGRGVLDAVERLGIDGDGASLWASFGVLRWELGGSHSGALLLVPVRVERTRGWRIRLESHELRVNPALLAYFEREFDLDLGEDRYRIESAGIQEYLDSLKEALEPIGAKLDDRIGLLSTVQRQAIEAGEVDVTPGVLLTESPRDGVLAGLSGAAETGLPLVPARRRALGRIPVPVRTGNEPVLRTTKRTGKEVLAACAGLSRRATQEFMDKGLWILYLGVGMLHWSDPADGRAEFQDSPLLLVPVRLQSAKRGASWTLEATEEEPLVNPALWMKLDGDLGLELPDLEEGEPLDAAALLGAVRAAVDGYADWSVEERVILSTFSFHKEVMYRDLRDNIERIVGHPIIAALASEPGTAADDAADFDFEPVPEDELDERAPAERAMAILDADASQRQCIQAARERRSFVMDGPPGTGKSQTIANMIAELLAAGQTVLFVSEKAAALDVVHNRLAHVGLDEYVLELHSHKTTRSAVASTLGASLLRHPRPSPSLTSADLEGVARRRRELSEYARALNEPLEQLGGRSLHHLLGWIAGLQHLPQAPVADPPPASVAGVEEIRELALRLRGTWEVVERGDDFAWRAASAQRWDARTEQRILAALDGASAALADLEACAEVAASDLMLDPPGGPREADQLVGLIELLGERPDDVPEAWLATGDPIGLGEAARALVERIRRHKDLLATGTAAAGPRWREIAADPESAERVAAELESIGVRPDPRDGVPDLHRLRETSAQLAVALGELRATGTDLAALLGLKTADLTLARTEVAFHLAGVARDQDPPVADWLRDGGGSRARRALDALSPLLRAERDAREAASDFDPSVLELDLDTLSRRFAEEHRGLRRLGGAYRHDRDALAATAPGARPRTAVEHIGAAVAWQKARAALVRGEAAHAAALGHQWSGTDTDLAALDARVQRAVEATTATAGWVADEGRFTNVVSGTRRPPGLAELAGSVEARYARVVSAVPGALEGVVAQVLDRAIPALERAAAVLAQAVELTERADSARGTPGTLTDALAAHRAAGEVAALEREHDADEAGRTLLGADHHAIDASPEGVVVILEWVERVRAVHSARISRAAAHRLTGAAPASAELVAALATWRASIETLLLEFEDVRRDELRGELDARFGDAAALLQRLRATRGDVEVWIAHAAAATALAGAGAQAAFEFCVEHRVSSGHLVDVVRRSSLEALADRLLEERADVLATVRAVDRDRRVGEFAAADRRVVADAAHRVMAETNARRPNTILGVATIIANEAQKKKRHMPVSELLRRTAPVAQAVKPCFMMSPLSVSQFLAPDMEFDVVIFDEASQVRPCDAVNALYRGGAMIVAGDQKQLPPTSFFEQSTSDGDEWTEESLSEFDSVLDLAKGSGAFRSLSLRWHYRSRHEHLIAFSNHRFYEGGLVTFPSPAESASDLGVALRVVDGVYRRGTSRDNPVEAAEIADRVFWHAENGAASIGVVAFSEAQASLIEEVLRRDERREDPRFAELFSGSRLDGLFIKNLENVQGDERDVVIFSVGYGPDEQGKLTMNFGPINREGGWRRLNVAITRARQRVEVICSFPHEALEPGSRTRGIDELRRYLAFAESGPGELVAADGLVDGGEPESPFEEAVLRTVRGWGYDVVPQVGTAGYRIDLAIRHAEQRGRFALGIECDGAMYHSSKVARDRDRLRDQVLGGLGWTLHRIWGPSWYRDRSGEERRLREAIERAMLIRDPVLAEPSARPKPVVVDFDELELDAPPAWAEPYEAVTLPVETEGDPGNSRQRPVVRDRLLRAVAEEGPIVEELLSRRVADAWDVILSERRRRAIADILKNLEAAGTLVRHANAYCLPNQRIDLVRVPHDGDERSQREVRQVPDVELAEGIARLVAEARIVDEEEALRRTARLFGWRRAGPAIHAALMRAIEQLCDEGRIARDGNLLRAPESATP